LPGDRRAGGESGHHRDHQFTVLGMAAGLYQCPAVQSRARPADRSGSHYRNRFGVVSLSQNLAEETQRVIHGGAPFHSASAPPYGLRSSRTELNLLNLNVPGWARLNRQSGPDQLAKSTSGGFLQRLGTVVPPKGSLCSE